MGAILDALTHLGLASGISRSATIYALVSAAHVLGIALLVGPILLVDLRLLGLLRALDAPSVMVLRAAARVGVMLVMLSGVLLFSAKPEDYARNMVVWAKLTVVAAGVINALAFEWQVRQVGIVALLKGGGSSFALLSLSVWLAAILLGRWIAFV
jgi:hypothetical protein